MATQWTVELRLKNGPTVIEPVNDEAAANARITALKNPSASVDGWLEFADQHIRIENVLSLKKNERGKTAAPPE